VRFRTRASGMTPVFSTLEPMHRLSTPHCSHAALLSRITGLLYLAVWLYAGVGSHFRWRSAGYGGARHRRANPQIHESLHLGMWSTARISQRLHSLICLWFASCRRTVRVWCTPAPKPPSFSKAKSGRRAQIWASAAISSQVHTHPSHITTLGCAPRRGATCAWFCDETLTQLTQSAKRKADLTNPRPHTHHSLLLLPPHCPPLPRANARFVLICDRLLPR
jgi:hypothetical protein